MKEKYKLLGNLSDQLKRVLGLIADLISLNLLFLLSCLLVVTAGAGFTSCYTFTFRLIRGDTQSLPFGSFFKDFIKCFKKSTLAWLLLLLALGIFAGDAYFAYYVCVHVSKFFLIFAAVMGVFVLGTGIWLFPLIARYENKLGTHIKNAFLMMLANLPKTLLSLVVWVVCIAFPVVMPNIFAYVGWMWIAFSFSLPMYVTALLFRKQLACEIPADEEKKED